MIGNIFQYLEKVKGKPLPLEYKLINNLLTEDELVYDSGLDLLESNITSLPNNLTINGNLELYGSNITSLPNNLYVDGWLDIDYTNISELPNNLYVGGDLWCRNTPLAYKIINDRSLLEKYHKQVKGKIIHYGY